MNEHPTIDGTIGGGQILRTALALSILTSRPFTIENIRSQRPKPGLQPQHLSAVRAAVQISGGEAKGDRIGSTLLTFVPGKVRSGDYSFRVETAGAMSLVLQTVYLPLALSDKPCRLEFRGGTHVPWAPIYEYVQEVWAKAMKNIGMEMSCELRQAGYYPKGQGHFLVEIFPVRSLNPLQWLERPSLREARAIGISSNLPQHVVEREFQELQKQEMPCAWQKDVRRYESCQPGNALFLLLDFGEFAAGFTGLGDRGKRAECVAAEAMSEMLDFWHNGAPVEEYLADQLLLPLSMVAGHSAFRTTAISQHLTSNAEVIRMFRPIAIEMNQNGTVHIAG